MQAPTEQPSALHSASHVAPLQFGPRRRSNTCRCTSTLSCSSTTNNHRVSNALSSFGVRGSAFCRSHHLLSETESARPPRAHHDYGIRVFLICGVAMRPTQRTSRHTRRQCDVHDPAGERRQRVAGLLAATADVDVTSDREALWGSATRQDSQHRNRQAADLGDMCRLCNPPRCNPAYKLAIARLCSLRQGRWSVRSSCARALRPRRRACQRSRARALH